MEVTLLGTGAADGWPNPFCTCTSCARAAAEGEVRAQTSALVDGRLLLDCGPETPRQSLRAGTDLTQVSAVLVTHAHPDHFDPAFLLYRSWVSNAPLRLVGPAPVLDACTHWLAPGQDVTLTAVGPGQELEVDGYQVRVLPAAHLTGEARGDAVLYAVRSPSGAVVLYATDTAEPTEQDLDAWADDGRVDVVLLEQTFGERQDLATEQTGHLTLTGFGRTLERMRAIGLVDERTDVVAVHLSHHNPPPSELRRRLTRYGARMVPDGTVVRAAGAGAAAR